MNILPLNGHNDKAVYNNNSDNKARLEVTYLEKVRDNASAELQDLAQWVVWKLEKRYGKQTKVPYNPLTKQKAKTNNPATWGTFDDACAAYLGGQFAGLGFVFSTTDPYVGVDLDHVIDEHGILNPEAAKIVAQFNSYAEISPSGTGLHILIRGSLPPGGRRTGFVEMYESGRYFTITGDHWPDAPTTIEVRQRELDELHASLFPQDESETNFSNEKSKATGGHSLDDDALIRKAMIAKNGPKFIQLWNGNWQADGYPSSSEADIALCNLLAFWTVKDGNRMDRLFRRSRLFRPKWDEIHYSDGRTYGQGTIDDAIQKVRNVYSGRTDGSGEADSSPTADGAGELEYAFLIRESADDEGNAQCLHRLFSGQFLNTSATGWLRYNGKYWEASKAQSSLDRATVVTLKNRQLAAVVAERDKIVKEARPSRANVKGTQALYQSLVVADIGEFDNDPDVINTQSGVLDLRNGQLLTHGPGQRFTYCIPVGYVPDADSSMWSQWLSTVVGDGSDTTLRYVQQVAGYCLTGHTREESIFYANGPQRAGKGVFTETNMSVLGPILSQEVAFKTFTQRRDADSQNFDLAPLKACRFVAASESNRYEVLNTGVVKAITGGNDIHCAFKHRNFFTYRPQYKVWLTSNHQIRADVEDDAVWGRVKVIEFPNSFAGREDKRLKERMKTKTVLRGVLAWAVQGAIDWYRSPTGLVTPQTVTEATKKQRRFLDYVGQWLEQYCSISDPEAWTSNQELFVSYRQWCTENGVEGDSLPVLGRSLSNKGFETGKQRRMNGKPQRGVLGIRIDGR